MYKLGEDTNNIYELLGIKVIILKLKIAHQIVKDTQYVLVFIIGRKISEIEVVSNISILL